MTLLVVAAVAACAPASPAEPTDHIERSLLTITGSYGQSVRGTVDGFPFLMLRGTHTERGKAHGALAAQSVINSVDAMAAFINSSGTMTWTQALDGLAYFNFPARYNSELAGIIQGVQEALPSPSQRILPSLGREMTLNDLKVLQVGDMLELAQCTQFSAWGSLTPDGNTIVGRNWDYPPLFSTNDAMIIASDPAEAGLLSTMDAMWFGMVGSGIATLREDGLYISADDASIDEPPIPFPSPTPSALRARELAESIPLSTAPSSFAAGVVNSVPLSLIFHVSFPMPHAQGLKPSAIEYDSTPGGWGITTRTATAAFPNAVVLSNHFLQTGAPTPGDSVTRYNAVWNGLQSYASAGTKMGFNEAKNLMTQAARSNTRYSAVAWPGERKLMVAVSPSSGVPATSGVYHTALWNDIFNAFPPSGPTITQQPNNATVIAGQTATFTVTATGTGLTYQWQKSGTNIAGATSSAYTTPATTLADNGATFRCVVSSSAGGSVTSSSATLTVNAASGVTITQQPTDKTVTVGQTATFTVTATGTSLTYQWQKNGTNVSGATAASYTTPATVYDDNGTQYRCVVSGSGGATATSSAATLVVNSTATSPTGIRGQYYTDMNYTNLYSTITDPYINFTWGPEGDNFSIRWTGQVQAGFSEATTFTTTSDGAVRVWLNNQLIIDHYTLHNSTASLSSAPIQLVAGRRYNLRVDYYDTVNTSVIQLRWQSTSQPSQIIPTSRLFLP